MNSCVTSLIISGSSHIQLMTSQAIVVPSIFHLRRALSPVNLRKIRSLLYFKSVGASLLSNRRAPSLPSSSTVTAVPPVSAPSVPGAPVSSVPAPVPAAVPMRNAFRNYLAYFLLVRIDPNRNLSFLISSNLSASGDLPPTCVLRPIAAHKSRKWFQYSLRVTSGVRYSMSYMMSFASLNPLCCDLFNLLARTDLSLQEHSLKLCLALWGSSWSFFVVVSSVGFSPSSLTSHLRVRFRMFSFRPSAALFYHLLFSFFLAFFDASYQLLDFL